MHMHMQSKQYGHEMVCKFDQVLDQTKALSYELKDKKRK